MNNNSCTILLAGGSGKRMNGTTQDKILTPICGVPAVNWVVKNFYKSQVSNKFIFVCRDDAQENAIKQILKKESVFQELEFFFCRGGKERQNSVLNGLDCALANKIPDSSIVFIHDCARPLIHPQSLQELFECVQKNGAAVLAHPCTNTIKRVVQGENPEHPCILEDLERSRLWEMETPQVFPLKKIHTAYKKAIEEGQILTDDVAAFNDRICIVKSKYPNPKLTVPADLIIIEELGKKSFV